MEEEKKETRLQLFESKEKTVVFENKALEYLGGFVQLPRVVLRADNISIGSKLTYALLLSYAWQEDYCYPAQENLAKDLNITRQSVIKYLKDLQSKDLIEIKRRGLNRPNIYTIKEIPDRMSKKLTSGSQNSSLQDVNKQDTNINNVSIKNNRYRYNNKDVQDVVSFFNNLFPDKKDTLRYKDVRTYIGKIGKAQLLANIEVLKFNAKTNPAGYLRTVIEKGDGKVRVSKAAGKRKVEEEKHKKDQEWIEEVKKSREKTTKLLTMYNNLPKEEQERIKQKVEENIGKRVFGRSKLVEILIAGQMEKEYPQVGM